MALKYGSSSKSNTFTRSAFPMQSGTASHASAVKQVEDYVEKDKQRKAQLALEERNRIENRKGYRI